MTVPHRQTAVPPTAPADPELDLLAAIVRQALTDLKPTAHDEHRVEAARFWRGDEGTLAWFCTLLGLDAAQMQAHVRARYPEVLVPALQLALTLEAS